MRVAALLLAIVCAVALAPDAAAQAYKWVDADGQVHFGDTPPPEATDAQRLAIQSKPTDPADLALQDAAQQLKTKQTAMEDEVRANQQKRAADELAARREACDNARKRYDGLQHSRKFATTGADGKESWMSGDDADRMKSDLKAAADKACDGL